MRFVGSHTTIFRSNPGSQTVTPATISPEGLGLDKSLFQLQVENYPEEAKYVHSPLT